MNSITLFITVASSAAWKTTEIKVPVAVTVFGQMRAAFRSIRSSQGASQ